MARAKVLPALWAGFSLILQRPLAVIVWGVLSIVISALMGYLIDLALGTDLTAAMRDPAAATPRSARLLLVQAVNLAGIVAMSAVFYTATMRAILDPKRRAFFHIRLGKEEGLVAILFLIFYVLIVVAAIGVGVVIAIPIALATVIGGPALAGGVGLVAVPAGLAAAAWLAARMSMSMPMTIAEGRLRVFESWTFTRGYGWPLAGLMAALFAVVMVVLAIVMGAAVGLVSTAIGGGLDEAKDFFADPARIQAALPLLVPALILWSLISILILPVMVAPWARAYQIIAGAKGLEAESVFD